MFKNNKKTRRFEAKQEDRPVPFYRQLSSALILAVLIFQNLLIISPVKAASPAALVSENIVISQVYGGGGNAGGQFNNDFIELFNRGTAPIDITGWSVQYASAT